MGKLVSAAVLLAIAFSLLLAAAMLRSQRLGPVVNLLRLAGYGLAAIALAVGVGSGMVVIDPGEVGVRHAFGFVDSAPLLAGIRLVAPWSSIERYSTREEQWPTRGEQIEAIEALSSEQMGMHVEVSIRWQIDPMQAPKIYTEIGNEDQIRGAVLNAIRKGVRDGWCSTRSTTSPSAPRSRGPWKRSPTPPSSPNRAGASGSFASLPSPPSSCATCSPPRRWSRRSTTRSRRSSRSRPSGTGSRWRGSRLSRCGC